MARAYSYDLRERVGVATLNRHRGLGAFLGHRYTAVVKPLRFQVHAVIDIIGADTGFTNNGRRGVEEIAFAFIHAVPRNHAIFYSSSEPPIV
jgi:hypothetical protein